MIEKPNARRYLIGPRPIKIEGQANIGLFGCARNLSNTRQINFPTNSLKALYEKAGLFAYSVIYALGQ